MDDAYDALNDETFGAAVNDDWESKHENLVLLDSNGNSNSKAKDDLDDGDLGDLGNFNMKLFIFGNTLPCKENCFRCVVCLWFTMVLIQFYRYNKKIDFSIARMGLDDCDEAFDDIEGRVQLDPRVWARTAEHPTPSGKHFRTSFSIITETTHTHTHTLKVAFSEH